MQSGKALNLRSRAVRPSFTSVFKRPHVFQFKPSRALSEAEAGVLAEFKSKYCYPYDSDFAQPEERELVNLLSTAGSNRGSIPPTTVEGALLRLEEIRRQVEVPSIDGLWRLVFGTGTKIRAFQYIPVKEDFVLDTAGGKLALESVVGPFEFFIKGEVASWSPKDAVLGFQFTQVDIVYGGEKVWEVSPKTKPKTYTFFFVGESIAAARSSSGGVALLIKM